MSIKRKLIKNTGYNVLSYIYLLLTSFFSISILLNNLGRDLFGLYILIVSFIPLSSVFDFGLSISLIRKLSLPSITHQEKVGYWRTSLFLFLLISTFVAITAGIIYFYLSKSLPIFDLISSQNNNSLILLLISIIFINNINNHYLSLPQANQRFEIYNIKSILVGTANTLISAIVSGYTHNFASILTIQLLFHLITTISLIIYSLSQFSSRESTPYLNKNNAKELFSFGIKNFVGTLAGQVEAQFSNFVLGALASAKSITAFNIPQSIVIKGAGLISQFAQAFFPLSTSLLVKERILKLKKLYLWVQLITLLGGLVAVLLSYTIGANFLLWWLHDEMVVQSATPILKILSWYYLLLSLSPVPSALLQGLNKPQIPSFFALLTVILEIILSFILVPHLQAIGIAYSFLITQIFIAPIFFAVSWKYLQKEIYLHFPNHKYSD